MLYFFMDSIVNSLIIFLLFANLIVVFILLKMKRPEQNNTEQIFLDWITYWISSFFNLDPFNKSIFRKKYYFSSI